MLKDAILKIRKAAKEAQQKCPVESIAAIEQVAEDIENLNALINKELNKIESDRNLDDNIKRFEIRKMLEKAGRKLELLQANRTNLTLIEELEAKLVHESLTKDESVLKFLREREVRDRLYGIPSVQILSHFRKPLFDGSNKLLLDAILNSPPGFEMLPKDILQKLKTVRAKILNPEIAGELERIRRLYTSIEKIFWLVKKELDKKRREFLPKSLKK